MGPIGVFDSGIGGLSILQALGAELPLESFVYLADSAHAPYGERDDDFLIERSRRITQYFRQQHQIKLLVVACNTATAAAIQTLRAEHPDLPMVGVEPALKPAAALSQTHRIGVLATRSTLASAKYQALLQSLCGQAEFISQACDGLADAIEQDDSQKIAALCLDYTQAMGLFGKQTGQIDSLVLGCTHYPFVSAQIKAAVGQTIALFDSGEPVARQTRRLLEVGALGLAQGPARITLLASGATAALQGAAQRWLKLTPTVHCQPALSI